VVTPDAGQAPSVASLIGGLLNGPVSDLKMQPADLSLPQRDASSQTSGDDNRISATAKSERDQAAVPLGLVPPTVALPLNPAVVGNANDSQGSVSRPAPDSSRLNATPARVRPETAGTGGKSADASASTKIQPRQAGSSGIGDSPAADQSNIITPKASETAASFSGAGSQLLSAAGEGKNGDATLSPAAADPQTSQLDHESTGLAPDQTHPEIQVAYPASQINSAKLVERIGEAELRLGMRAGEFGNVDIRTSMVRNQFSAEISVERGELGRVMAAELPGLQTRLTDQRVPVANITIQNHTGGQSMASEQQKPRDGQQTYATNSVSPLDEDRVPPLLALEGTAMRTSRLDIHM